jgi:hypothetical protein
MALASYGDNYSSHYSSNQESDVDLNVGKEDEPFVSAPRFQFAC